MSSAPPVGVAAAVEQLWPAAAAEVQVIAGGMTNANFRVRVNGQTFVVQVQMPDEDAAVLGIDRHRQRRAHNYAAAAGVAPRLLATVPELRVWVCEWVDATPLLGPGSRNAAVVTELARMLRIFHAGPCDDEMRGPLADPFAGTRKLIRSAREVSREAARQFDFAMPFVTRFQAARGQGCTALTHGDLLPSNILCGPGRIWLIDYEYAATGDPLYDLGELVGKNDFSREEAEFLVQAYDSSLGERALAVVWLHRILALLREGLWAVAASTNTLDFDYLAYARSCRQKVADMLRQQATTENLHLLEAV